jgi:hypothetical protein
MMEVTTATRQSSHNYQQRIDEMLRANLLVDLPAGGTYRLAVLHADDYRFFEGGWCNCEPDFELTDVQSVLA